MKKLVCIIIGLVAPAISFGASAVAYGTVAYGYGYNFKTGEEAETHAKEMCEKYEGEEIEVIAVTEGIGYGAIATDGNILAAAIGFPTLFAAMARAKVESLKQGAKDPKIVASWFDRGTKPQRVIDFEKEQAAREKRKLKGDPQVGANEPPKKSPKIR